MRLVIMPSGLFVQTFLDSRNRYIRKGKKEEKNDTEIGRLRALKNVWTDGLGKKCCIGPEILMDISRSPLSSHPEA